MIESNEIKLVYMSLPVTIQSNNYCGRANSLTDWTCEFVRVTQGTFDNSDSKKNATNLYVNFDK